MLKPYGLRVIEFPDVADIKEMGSKSSVGGKSYFRSSADKARVRRSWKRKARAEGRALCLETV